MDDVPAHPAAARRTFLIGSLGLAGWASGFANAHDRDGQDLPPQGQTGTSQSVMLSGADAGGAHFVAIRACQYPDAGVTWLWCTVATPQGLFQFYSNRLPWQGPVLSPDDAGSAIYQAQSSEADAKFVRTGTLKAPQKAELSARFTAQGQGTPSGRRAQVSLVAEFEPLSGYAGLLTGRTEAFGHAKFVLNIAGKKIAFEGPSQFHEQTQTAARFVTPFIFSSLWSKDLFSTFLIAPPNGGGYVINEGRPSSVSAPKAELTQTGSKFTFTEGSVERSIVLETRFAYQIPIYGALWQGRFVKGDVFGKTVVGMVNSWLL